MLGGNKISGEVVLTNQGIIFDRYEIVEILQVLAYNRHKTRDSEKTANMIFDKLFEIISDGEV